MSRLLAIFTLAAAFVGIACTEKGRPSSSTLVQDDVGRTVSVPRDPRRVVALAPNLVEYVYLLGEESRLLARSEHSVHPEEAKSLPSIGGMSRPNLEAILALEPDLVLATAEGNPPSIVERLDPFDIPVFTLDRDAAGMEGVWEAIEALGKLLHAQDRATQIVTAGRSRLRTARSGCKDSEPDASALFLVWTQPAVAAGRYTHIDDLLRAACIENVLDESHGAWPTLGRESLVALNPEFIFVANAMTGGPPPGLEDLKSIPGLDSRFVRIEQDAVLRPTPNALQSLKSLQEALRENRDTAP